MVLFGSLNTEEFKLWPFSSNRIGLHAMSFGNFTLIPILLSKEVSDVILSMLKKIKTTTGNLKTQTINLISSFTTK